MADGPFCFTAISSAESARTALCSESGRGNEEWALAIGGVEAVIMRGRRMNGYVRARPEAYASDELRQRLLDAAVTFTQSLPQE